MIDNISDKMIEVWAEEMHANRAWLEGLGMQAMNIGAPSIRSSRVLTASRCW
jgi:hypothetical protein